MIGTITRSLPDYSTRDLVKSHLDAGWRWSIRLLDKHTDLISSGGILAITTCLLADKVFKEFPPIIPRLSLVLLNFSGIIWLNVQIMDLIKSCYDLKRVFDWKDWDGLVQTAAKVVVRVSNILLTGLFFGASVVGACGFPQISAALYIGMRPFALTTLVLNILTDLGDYFANKAILQIIDRIEEARSGLTMAKVSLSFLEIIGGHKVTYPEGFFANRIVRQIERRTVETFKEKLVQKISIEDVRLEAYKLFYNLKDGLVSKQAGTKANLSLTVLGYVSMGVCKAFPDTLKDMISRWTISVLYTDELIRQKFYEADLAERI